jgi:2,4-dienoyl-CoA reductase-like NADH-dependent reductase (Old Yellow Enzyme family)
VTAKNRFLLAPLTNMQSPDNGKLSNDEYNWLVKRAEGDFGIIMTCAMPVQKSGIGWPGQLSIYDYEQERGHKRLNKKLHELGALSIAQIFHAGMRANQKYAGNRVGVSNDDEKDTRGLTLLEIEEVKAAFVDCAIRAEQCNYDGVEIHAAHGYLLGQFLSDSINKRSDAYGGSFDNRSQIVFEIIAEIQKKTSPSFLIGVRLSPELFGLDTDEMVVLFTRLCKETNIDFIDLSLWDSFKLSDSPKYNGTSLLKIFTDIERGKKKLTVAGKIFSYEDMQILDQNNVDFFCLGRAAILDHQFPKRLCSQGPDFEAFSAPVSRSHLALEGLSEQFIDYMATWKNFVK